jgi:hypothetical protein
VELYAHLVLWNFTHIWCCETFVPGVNTVLIF